MVRVRVEGSSLEVAALIQEFRDKKIKIIRESKEYPNSDSDTVRIYLEID